MFILDITKNIYVEIEKLQQEILELISLNFLIPVGLLSFLYSKLKKNIHPPFLVDDLTKERIEELLEAIQSSDYSSSLGSAEEMKSLLEDMLYFLEFQAKDKV